MIAAQSSVSVEMLRLCLFGVLFTILFAGGVNSSNTSRNVTANEGDLFGIFVLAAANHNAKTCILKPPQNDIFEFTPNDVSATTEKYQVHQDSWIDCMVTVRHIDIKDEGIWVLTYDDELHDHATTASVNLTVIATEPENDEEEDTITVLSTINHLTRMGLFIDISLDKRSFEEECYVQPPHGELTKAINFNMENVTVQESSNFVSCRITLGPMSASLLGNWNLCGQSIQNDEMRCQPANIVWNNNNNPNAAWGSLTQTMFSHPVNYGGSVNPGVASTAPVATCHVITPNGEDLVITSDVNYPHIERIAFDRTHLCSINFTNIDSTSIGEWTIYGKFRSVVTGLHEIHLPLNFFLYNEARPYDQAYNVTILPEARYSVILGRTLEVSVQSVGQVDNCQYRMPTGQSYDLNNVIAPNGVVLKSVAAPACQITLSPITKDLLGEWQIIGKFSNGNQFTERRQTFHIIQEDPTNPIVDDFRIVENLTETILDTKLGASHRVTITTASFVENESCHLMTPNGLQYALIDGFHIPNVEIIEGNGIECGVKVDVLDLDMLGDWILIARATRTSSHIERRRHFSIRIEETLSLGEAITITEGADLYLSLPNATHLYHTCKLYANDVEVTDFEVDQFRSSSCGFIERNVTRAQHGTWAIVYGNQITYRATVEVNILESVEISVENMKWPLGSSVNITLGPEDAVYCRVIDFNGNQVYDGIGQCRLVVDRVTKAHQGWWSISVGVSGTVMLRHARFFVAVETVDSRPVVTTDVAMDGSSMIMTCSVPRENEVHACLFRDPGGNVLIASNGVGQGGYSGAVLRYESDSDSHICTLRLSTPSSEHRGIWRCAVSTARVISYGFLTVTTSMMDQTAGYYQYNTEPELKSPSYIFGGEEGNAVTMSCSIDTSVRYCYFRAPNGTVFTVGPSISSTDYEYVGNGLDAGECGIRFNNLWHNDTGNWSCHVGLVHNHEELSRSFEVSVYEPMWMYHGWHGSSVSLILHIGGAPELEYCRFVRIDGLGFMSDNVPVTYEFDSLGLRFGACALNITSPVYQDLQPWTVFAKPISSETELYMTSTFIPLPPVMSETSLVIPILMWTIFALVCLLVILAAVSLVPKKNREWTYQRASIIRNSFRKQKPRTVHTDMLY